MNASAALATIEIQAKSSGLAAQLREARAKLGTFADGVATKFKGAASKFGGFLGNQLFGEKNKKGERGGGAFQHAVGNLASGAISKVGDYLTDAGKSAFSFQERIERLKIAAGETPEVMNAWAKQMRDASVTTGMNKDQVLGAAEAYVRLTGDVKTARENTLTFAKVAQATGSSAEEIAVTAAAMGQNMKVPAAQFEEMFSALSIQGKAGAIELKDLASELSTIAPQWAQFGKGTGAKGVRELGAAMQIVKKGFGGDAAETTTGLSNFLTAVQKKGKRFGDLGVGSFFTKKGELKGVLDIVDQISKKGIRKDKLITAFGSTEAYRAFIQLRDNRAEVEKLVKASEDGASIQRDFDEYMGSAAGRSTKAWNNVKNAVQDIFTPERLEGFANALEDLASHADEIARAVGAVGTALGALSSFGKSVRGLIGGGNNNPFIAGMGGSQGKVQEQAAYNLAKATHNTEAMKKIEELREKRGGYDRTVEDILGGEKNERTSPESLRRAVMASFSENLGSTTAGNRYLANALGSGQEVADMKDKVSREALLGTGKNIAGMFGLNVDDKGQAQQARELLLLLQKIAANTAAGTDVKVDGDSVAKASKNARSHRGKVAR